MSVYNGEAFIREASASILEQTYGDLEFIIVNDGSTDTSLSIMQEYATKDERIRIIDQENTGLTVALCRGIEAASGQYIARMDVDDFSHPQRFEKQMALFRTNADLVAVTCDVQHVSMNGPTSGRSSLDRDPRLMPLLLCFAIALCGLGQVIFSRKAYEAAGGYNPAYRYSQDYDLWTRLADRGPFGSVREVLYHWLAREDGVSTRHKEAQAACSQRVQRNQYAKVIGQEVDEATARALWQYTRREPPEETSVSQSWRVATLMLRGAQVFFHQHPELRHEKFETLRAFAAVWRWRRKECATPSPLLRAAFWLCVLRLGCAALVARAMHGTSDPVASGQA